MASQGTPGEPADGPEPPQPASIPVLWTVAVGLAAVWLYTAPRVHNSALFSELADQNPLLFLLAHIGEDALVPERLATINCGLLTVGIGLFVGLPSLILRRLTLWTVVTLAATTLSLLVIGYWGLYRPVPPMWLDAGFLVLVIVSAAASSGHRRLSAVQRDVRSKIGRVGIAVLVAASALDVYVLGPAATGRSEAHKVMPTQQPGMFYVLRMSNANDPLDGRLVNLLIDTPRYLVVQEYVQPTEYDRRAIEEAILADAEGVELTGLLTYLRDPTTPDDIVDQLQVSNVAFSVANPLTIVDKSRVDYICAVLAPDLIRETFCRALSLEDTALAQRVEYPDTGGVRVKLTPTDSKTSLGFTRTVDGNVVITTRPAPSAQPTVEHP